MSRTDLEEWLRFHIALKKHLAKTIKDKFFAIHEMSTDYTVDFLCRKFKVTRQGYYLWLKNGKPKYKNYNQDLASLILDTYLKFKCVYGYKMICLLLNKYKKLSLKPWVVYRHMRILNIKAIRRHKKPKYDKSGDLRHPNLLKRNFKATQLNEKWVTDITYIRTKDGMRYLSIVRDLYNGEIINWKVSNRPDNNLSHSNLKNAWIIAGIPKGVIVHSDQGSNYTSSEWVEICNALEIKISMSRRGNSPDNGACESWFGTLKNECIYTYKIAQLSDRNIYKIINNYIDFYNYIRPIRNQIKTPFEIRTGSIQI
ncbi:IS3 family transposase [Mesoplasma coleopterae]|nr:IS3 family transposase [Mesoplasma coleopterae]